MYVVTVDFVVKPEHTQGFHAAILQQAKDSLTEAGCQQFDVAVDPDHANKIFLYELYDDLAAFEVHKNSAHTKALFGQIESWLASKTLRIFNLIGRG